MWAYRARDVVATAMHGIWGSFWIGYGLYNLLIALGVLPAAATSGPHRELRHRARPPACAVAVLCPQSSTPERPRAGTVIGHGRSKSE
jgi:hypothetical protein